MSLIQSVECRKEILILLENTHMGWVKCTGTLVQLFLLCKILVMLHAEKHDTRTLTAAVAPVRTLEHSSRVKSTRVEANAVNEDYLQHMTFIMRRILCLRPILSTKSCSDAIRSSNSSRMPMAESGERLKNKKTVGRDIKI